MVCLIPHVALVYKLLPKTPEPHRLLFAPLPQKNSLDLLNLLDHSFLQYEMCRSLIFNDKQNGFMKLELP